MQVQLGLSQLEEADGPDRSSLEVEVDLSKLHNVAILIIEAVRALLEWDLEVQQLEPWLADFLELKTLHTLIIWEREDLET